MKIEIHKNDRFGLLTVIKEVDRVILPSGQANRVIMCKCDCGNITNVRLLHLVRLRIKSCGCLAGVKSGEAGKSELYRKWAALKYRCLNPDSKKSHIYYDRGINICDEWINNFMAFKNWALINGFKPGLMIDRIDNEKGYCPENCRFVTPQVSANNRRVTQYVTYKGETKSLRILLREMDKFKHFGAISARIKRGWTHDLAIDTPIKSGNYYNKGYNYKWA
jgi:hypothetical protein